MEPGETSVALYFHDRMGRAGDAGVTVAPVDGVTTTRLYRANAAGFALLGIPADAKGGRARLRLLGDWLPYRRGGVAGIERSMMYDQVITVPVAAPGTVVRVDVYPAVEVTMTLMEGMRMLESLPVTVEPVSALATRSLTFTPDNTKANLPCVRVPARPGDTYRVTLPESYLGDARTIATFTVGDPPKSIALDCDVLKKEFHLAE